MLKSLQFKESSKPYYIAGLATLGAATLYAGYRYVNSLEDCYTKIDKLLENDHDSHKVELINEEKISDDTVLLTIYFQNHEGKKNPIILGTPPGCNVTFHPLKKDGAVATGNVVSHPNKENVADILLFLDKNDFSSWKKLYCSFDEKKKAYMNIACDCKKINKYLGNGKLELKSGVRSFKNIMFICDRSGIGSFYSIIRAINSSSSDKTVCTLYYINDSESDIVLRKRMDVLNDRESITIHMHVLNPSNIWRGFSGPISADHFAEALGIQNEPGVLIRCHESLQKNVTDLLEKFTEPKSHLNQFNVKKDNIILF